MTERIDYTTPRSIQAFQFGAQCPQVATILNPTEDCLFANVWTPTLSTGANLPVMVSIHSGGFTIGTATENDSQLLALRDVVVVTFNYRVGVFGFLAADTPDAPGNAGLWDQVLAIEWTRDYIKQFGGNPNDITLFGESSGAMSVSMHVLMNQTNGLFSKAIIQSGIEYPTMTLILFIYFIRFCYN